MNYYKTDKRKKQKLKIQSILVPREFFNLQEARKWIKNHNFKTKFRNKKIHVTKNFFRFRQRDPKRFNDFRSEKLNNGVVFIYGLRDLKKNKFKKYTNLPLKVPKQNLIPKRQSQRHRGLKFKRKLKFDADELAESFEKLNVEPIQLHGDLMVIQVHNYIQSQQFQKYFNSTETNHIINKIL